MSTDPCSGRLIAFEFSAPDARPIYIGLNNTVSGVVAAVAPILGGWLAQAAGYRFLFALAAGTGLVGFAFLRWMVHEPRQSSP